MKRRVIVFWQGEIRFSRATNLYSPHSSKAVVASVAEPFVKRREWHPWTVLGEEVYVERTGQYLTLHQNKGEGPKPNTEEDAWREAREKAASHNREMAVRCQEFAAAYAASARAYQNKSAPALEE